MKKILLVLSILIVCAAAFIFYSYRSFASVSEGVPIKKYDSPGAAVLVVDIQRGITDKESTYGLDPRQKDEMLINNNLIFDEKKKGLHVVYIRQVFADDFLLKLFTGGKMQKGSLGAEISPELKVVSGNIFVKHISDSFSNPELEKFLVANRINHLYVTGLDVEACVAATVQAALNRKYRVTVIKDAVAGKSDERRENKLKEFTEGGVEIISTADFLTMND